MTLTELVELWGTRAAELAPYAAPAAEAFRCAARELEGVMRASGDEPLTLREAALASGFSAEHLRHLIANGTIPNAGRRGSPRVLRRDVPRKAIARAASGPMISAGAAVGAIGYDLTNDAIAISTRRSAR